MSKKKSFSGSTMTLKDFHGGSIPSDLRLPSAPGMTVDRSPHDRQNSGAWMNHGPVNRGYGGDRGGFLRQGSGNGVRAFEDKALYFSNPANIGRNYDEDERKPVDNDIRRGHSTDSFEDRMYEERMVVYDKPAERCGLDNRASSANSTYLDSHRDRYSHDEFSLISVGPPPRTQLHVSQERSLVLSAHQQELSIPHSPVLEESTGFYTSRHMSAGTRYSSQRHQSSLSPPRAGRQASGMTLEQAGAAAAGGASNVWTARRESESSRGFLPDPVTNDVSGAWRTQTTASRIAQASAVEKVSSGRWNTRLSAAVHEQPQYLVGQHSQSQGRSYEGRREVSDMTESSQIAFSSEDNFGQIQYSTDGAQELYIENARDGFKDYERTAYMDGNRGTPGRGNYSYVGPATFPGQYQDAGQRALSPANRDTPNTHTLFLESVRDKYADDGQGRYVQVPRHNFTDPGWRSSAGYLDTPRPSANEGSTFVEPGQGTQSNLGWGGSGKRDYVEGRVGSYVDSNRGAFTDFGRRSFGNSEPRTNLDAGHGGFSHRSDAVPSRTEIGRRNFGHTQSIANVDSGCGGYPQHGDASPVHTIIGRRNDTDPGFDLDSGHGGYSLRYDAGLILTDGRRNNTEHRTDVDSRQGGYHQHDGGDHVSDSSKASYFEGSRPPCGYERGQDSPGYRAFRDSYSTESLRSAYIADTPNMYARQGSQSPYSKEYDRGISAETAVLQAARETRDLVGDETVRTNYGSQTPLDLTGKNAPNERPKLKLFPRSKPLVNTTPESPPFQAPFQGGPQGEMQPSIEGRQFSESMSPEPSLTDDTGTIPTMHNSSIGSSVLENDEETSRRVGRPKLILKPRSQSADVLEDLGLTKERQSVFGGARPRELVLKERGVDDSVIAGIEVAPIPGSGRPTSGGNRTNGGVEGEQQGQQAEKFDKAGDEKSNIRRTELSETGSNRYMDRQDSNNFEYPDNRGRKNGGFDQDKKDDRRGPERYENRGVQVRRESERQDVDKQDSWRHSAEASNLSFGPPSLSPQSEISDSSSRMVGRFGGSLGSSAAELAQVFSCSTSLGSGIGGTPRGYVNQRTPLRSPVRGHETSYEPSGPYGPPLKDVSFSRLTETPPGVSDGYASGFSSGYMQSNGY